MKDPIYPPQMSAGFNIDMGFELIEWSNDLAVSRVILQDKHLNSQGIVHGGVYCAFLDFTSGMCGVYGGADDPIRTCVTLSLTTNFLSPARRGTLIGRARRTGGGRSIFFAEGSIEDSDGNILATSTGTFKYNTKKSK
jgi:uncharacterized protein (TIGR00369 family)